MPSHRVIPVYEPRGLYASSAAIAILLGPPMGINELWGSVNSAAIGPWAQIAVVFLLPLVFIVIFATRCQRTRPVFLTGLVFGFSFWLSCIVAQQLAQPTVSGATLLGGLWVGFLVAAGSVGLITGLTALVLRWLVRFMLVIYIEQTGGLCWRCGYPTDPASQSRCSECGQSLGADPARPRFMVLMARVRRWARPTLVVLLLMFFGVAATVIARRGYSIHRFQSAFPADDAHRPGGFIQVAGPEDKTIQLWTAGAWAPFPASTSLGLIASYLPEDKPGLPAMQLRLTSRPAPNTFIAVSPEVFCSLDRAQADFIIRQGLPAGLVEAMQVSGTPANGAFIERTEIDPTPYFPR